MKTQSPDTTCSAEQVLIALQRKKSVSQKLEQVRSLSATVMGLSRRAIARARKPANEIEANLLFVELHYGAELAGRLKRYLHTRCHDRS
jgi:hypothetical protein